MLMLGFHAKVNKAELVLSSEVDAAEWIKYEDALSKIREGSIAWHVVKAKRPLQILGMVTAMLAAFTAFSSAAADDMAEYKVAHAEPVAEITFEEVCEEVNTEPELISLGEFKITYYCTEDYPHICNNGDATKTATGTTPTAGRTIAVDPSVIPYGTEVIINDHTYVAEDCGGAIKGNRIDIVVDTHEEALRCGVDHCEAFVKAGEI